MKKIVFGLILGVFLLVLGLGIYVYLTPFSQEQLLPSQESIVQMSQYCRIADAVQECLIENGIKSPQSEESIIKLLGGENPKKKNYLLEVPDLKQQGNTGITDSTHQYSYSVRFDGKNIIVHIPNLDRPYIRDINSKE
jgi:hypothetical protein